MARRGGGALRRAASGPGRAPARWLLPLLLPLLAAGCGGPDPADAATVRVAVAANFGEVQAELARSFAERSGHRVLASTGSTGQLYAQIRNGAPFDLFLAADAEHPRRLLEEGLAVPGSRFTYAVGRLALYGPGLDSASSGVEALRAGRYTHLAIANPRTAPYGAAAEEVLERLGIAAAVGPRIVRGENVAQTLQFVHSGAAELGFVALAQVIREPARAYWIVPSDHYAPILQDAVLLRRAEGSEAARAYLRYLRGDEGRRVIESFGYATDAPAGP